MSQPEPETKHEPAIDQIRQILSDSYNKAYPFRRPVARFLSIFAFVNGLICLTIAGYTAVSNPAEGKLKEGVSPWESAAGYACFACLYFVVAHKVFDEG